LDLSVEVFISEVEAGLLPVPGTPAGRAGAIVDEGSAEAEFRRGAAQLDGGLVRVLQRDCL